MHSRMMENFGEIWEEESLASPHSLTLHKLELVLEPSGLKLSALAFHRKEACP